VLLALASFAIWVLFAVLPMLFGGAVREAWDTAPYWTVGVPLLLLSVALAGYASGAAPWKLALWAACGHIVAMMLTASDGASLGLLPLAIVVVGLPMFAALTAMAWLGRKIGMRTRVPD
jgi:hypothetical protein